MRSSRCHSRRLRCLRPPAILCAGMRLRPIHGMALGILTVLLGLGALVSFPAPPVHLQAVELDARPASTHQAAQVSPRPRLVVAIDRAIPATSWRILFDGKPIKPPDPGSPTRLLELSLPGPLALDSRHVIEIGAPGLSSRFVLRVVPPLQATVSIRMVDLQADQPANIRVTVHFSQPVADRMQPALPEARAFRRSSTPTSILLLLMPSLQTPRVGPRWPPTWSTKPGAAAMQAGRSTSNRSPGPTGTF